MRALIVALALAPATLLAQQPRALDLGRPTATHAEPFGLIGGLRERQDGTVLIADPTDGVLRHLRLSRESLTITTFPGVSNQTVVSHAVAAKLKPSTEKEASAAARKQP